MCVCVCIGRGNDLFDKTTCEIVDFVSRSIKGGGKFLTVMDLDNLGFKLLIPPPPPPLQTMMQMSWKLSGGNSGAWMRGRPCEMK